MYKMNASLSTLTPCAHMCENKLLFHSSFPIEAHISGLYPATFLDLSLCVLEAWTSFHSLILKMGILPDLGPASVSSRC